MVGIYCPFCGQQTESGYEFCQNCGQKLPIFQQSDGDSGGGCFIATAAYGTPFAKDINILRKWRDTSLMNKSSGRFFVKLYYKTSPPIAFLVSKSEELKKIVRFFLKPFIKYLNEKYKF